MDGIKQFDDTNKTMYAFGRCHQFMKDFAEEQHMNYDLITQRVAALLHATAGGEVMGVEEAPEVVEEEEVIVPKAKKASKQTRWHCRLCGQNFNSKLAKGRHYYNAHAKQRGYWRRQKPVKKRLQLEANRARTAKARAALVAKRAATKGEKLPKQVQDALSRYNEAVAQEPVNGVAVGV